MTFDDIVDLAEKAGCDVSAIDGREYKTMWCDSYQLERFAAALIQSGAASREAEIAELKDALGYDWDKYKASQMALRECMQMVVEQDAEIAELAAALERCREYMELPAQNRTVQPYSEVCEVIAKVRKPT